MKTAEDWETMRQLHVPLPRTKTDAIKIIREIQLDAWKQGYTDAIGITGQNEYPDVETALNRKEI